MRVRFRVTAGDVVQPARLVDADAVRLGRDPACEIAFDPVVFPRVSSLHARIACVDGGFLLFHESQRNPTLLNDQPIDGSAPVRVGDRVRLGLSGPIVTLLTLEAEGSSSSLVFDDTVRADEVHKALLRGTASVDRFAIGDGGVIGREAGWATFLLDHPHVSRQHARLTAAAGSKAVVTDLGSSNGTFVNGQRISQPTVLEPGDRLDVGPFRLRFDGASLVGQSRANNVELAARGVTRVVTDRATGRPLTLLHGVDLVVRPREFLALLGPSGSGKSTLLTILSGRNPPDGGTVTVNGADLHGNFEAIKEDVAVVPQREALPEALAVGQALRYTAELRLPADTTEPEVTASVADILEVVGLGHRRDTPIRALSGGQLKRASLANELIARPSLLFLDEVTSGLDEQTDREVMELFRKVADGGKTVVCITHNLANVEATCHLVAILTEGGWLAFVGTPEEAKAYFGVPRLGEIYKTLAARPPEEWRDRFQTSPLHPRYVAERLAGAGDPGARSPVVPPRRPPRARVARQASVLTRRYLAIWRGDWPALLVLLGQAVLVALLLVLVFGDVGGIANPVERRLRSGNLLLLLAVSAFWFGCNTAAKELVKERVIFLRERAINLRIVAYFLSKLRVLALIAAAQVLVLFGVVRLGCGPPGAAPAQGLTLLGLALAGTTLGLMLSALARTEEVATALVPIAVIPQIVLAGVIAPLSGLALGLARGFVTVHWGQQALEDLLDRAEGTLAGASAGGGWIGALTLVLVQAVVFVVATLVVLRRSARSSAR